MTVTARLIPLRPLATEPSSQLGGPTRSVRDNIEQASTFGTCAVSSWGESRGKFFSDRKGYDSPEEKTTKLPDLRKTLPPDQEFFRLSALFSPLRDSFAAVEIASDLGARTHTFLSYLPSVNSVGGAGQYEMNTALVQGLMRPAGSVLDCHL